MLRREVMLMGEKERISKHGDDLVVRIPECIAQEWGVEEGSEIEIASRGEQVVLRKQTLSLDALLAQISPENRHPEVDFGQPQGKEIW